MRKPITNRDVIKTIQDISDATEQYDDNFDAQTLDLMDFIFHYLIANTDDIQLAWNDSIEEREK